MYGNGQVLMSSSTNSMGVAAENVMSSSDHHHHHHQHAFFMSSPVRNPNSFNFMSAASAIPSYLPFPTLIPKEEGGLLGLRGGKDDMDSLSEGDQLELEVGGGMTSANELDIINNHFHHQSDQDASLQPPGAAGGSKKKRYHRHTAHQIQEMEALFKECPHPDDKQRLKLSHELGLKPRQVKFWFQNRRTQMKAQQDRSDNVILRTENDGLKTENYRLQALMRSLMCPTCGGASLLGEVAYDEQHLRLENSRLKEELDRLCNIASRYSGRSFQSMGPPQVSPPPPVLLQPSLDLDMGIYSRHFQEPSPMPPPSCSDHGIINPMPFLLPDHQHPGSHQGPFPGGPLLLDEEHSLAMDLALSSLDELAKMCQTDAPLWLRSLNTNNGGAVEVLDLEEHSRMFPWVMSAKQQYNVEFCRTEATRHSALVIMNSLNLVDAFLDPNKWVELFPSIVSRAKTLQIVASGVSGQASGSLHLMYAELQVLSPLVPTRETYFLRFCHHNPDGIWTVVDLPIDSFQCSTALQPSLPRYRRRPSGCIIQDMPNGYSRVTWVEHAEVLEEKPVHLIFNQYVNNGMAFGAHRWLAVLQRQCERIASQMARNISDLGVIQSPEARKNLMKLSERMIRMFCSNMSTTGGQSWTAVSDPAEDTVRIATRKVTEPGQPNGVILSAVSTTWMPYPHDQVFSLLRNEHKRSQLEALSNGYSLQEVAHIANGSDPGNCISLLRINVASNSSQNVDLMLQESCTDSSGSLIVYTTVEVNYIQLVMSGEDPSCIPLLPLGFSIIPFSADSKNESSLGRVSEDGGPSTSPGGPGGEGCLLTVGLQVHTSTVPTARLNLSSVTAINNHLCNAVSQINAALGSNNEAAVPSSPPPVDAAPTNLGIPFWQVVSWVEVKSAPVYCESLCFVGLVIDITEEEER
ncbi:hypothetical protein V2J09_014785 [Rumex salicifolius]